MWAAGAFGQTLAPRCFVLEVYPGVQGSEPPAKSLVQELSNRAGVTVRAVDVDADPKSRERRQRICDYYRLPPSSQPIIYGCGRAVTAGTDATVRRRQLDEMLTLTAFVREGCPHCAEAKRLLRRLPVQYPGLHIIYREMTRDRTAGAELEALTRRYQTRAASLPVLHYCNKLQIGYDHETTTGRLIEQTLRTWSGDCPRKPAAGSAAAARSAKPGLSTAKYRVAHSSTSPLLSTAPLFPVWSEGAAGNVPVSSAVILASDIEDLPLPPAGGDEFDGLPLPATEEDSTGSNGASSGDSASELDAMQLPLFGRVQVEQLGLPLFTIAVGLVDGFNPCAMWVLLFLLSILVNLHDRWKIFAVAGTFVVISGLAYFAFMAAWLNVFRFVGMLRPAQIALGLIAVLIGAVHVKDFFALHRGLSFSIPEAAKPGIYARVRRIVTAEHLLGAILGAAVLAVLVNIVELLCTAGLPALYTQILSMRQFPPWKDYMYLGLYNLAYMFDDAVMVGIVVATLGKHKLQEREGRWLKLLSGLVILLLGVLILFKPQWLL